MQFQKDYLPSNKCFQLQLLKFSFFLSIKLALDSGVGALQILGPGRCST